MRARCITCRPGGKVIIAVPFCTLLLKMLTEPSSLVPGIFAVGLVPQNMV